MNKYEKFAKDYETVLNATCVEDANEIVLQSKYYKNYVVAMDHRNNESHISVFLKFFEKHYNAVKQIQQQENIFTKNAKVRI